MEITNGRRGFLKGFGLFSAVAAGVATSHFANTSASSVVRDPVNPVLAPPVDQSLAPLGKINLTLSADNSPPPPPPPPTSYSSSNMFVIGSGSSSTIQPILSIGSSTGNPEHNNVKMSVGKDNRLWIEVDGQWRRVALEG